MVVQKKQVMHEVDKEIEERVAAAIILIDNQLSQYSGDTVVVNLIYLDISQELGSHIYRETIGKLIKTYKDAGWNVGFSNDIGEISHFTFD